MQHYEKSADFFKGEESNSSANKCMLKVEVFFFVIITQGGQKITLSKKI